MTDCPEIARALEPGEKLLWQGHPEPGRRVPLRATLIAALLFFLTLVLLAFAWYLAIWHNDRQQIRLIAYGLIGSGAFFTYLGLRFTVLDRRRARARDKRTAYAITDRRALLVAGPYNAEVRLTPGVAVKRFGESVAIEGENARIRFERLDDATSARDILIAQIEGGT